MDRRALSALSLAVFLFAPSSRAASPPSALRVEVSVCPANALSAQEVARALRAELDADGVVHTTEAGVPGVDGALFANVGCDAAQSTLIRLQAAASGRESRRAIVLADAPTSARLGLLALSASELVRSDWAALVEKPPEGAPEPSAAQYPLDESAVKDASTPSSATHEPSVTAQPVLQAEPPRHARAAAPSKHRAWAVSAAAELRWFVDYGSASFGGGLGADVGRWRLRTEALFSSAHDSLGTASLGSGAACVGYRLFEKRFGPVMFSNYPAVAAGITWMRGTQADAGVRVTPATGLYADLRLVAEARLVSSWLSPTLAAALGRATGFVARSDGRAVGATGGFFFGASAGASY